MPNRPGRPCRVVMCPGLAVAHGYCPGHQHLVQQRQQQIDARRGTAAQRGYDARWRAYRQRFLLEHPVCKCGCGQISAVVDHITPVSGPDDPLFWDPANHQALSVRCHNRKTAERDGGWGNRR